MKLPRLIAASCAAMLALGTAASMAADPIVIGVSIAQSPPGSVVQGTQVKDGVEIVTKIINDKGGVLGRPLEIVYEDNQGIPEKGRAAAEKLIARDKVVAITGGHQSSVCLAEIEVAHRYKMPYVNTNCWSDDVRAKGYPEVFNPGNYNTRVSSAMADTIAALKVKRVVAFAENTDYGIGQAKLLGDFLKKAAPDTEYKYVALDRAGKDFTPAVLPLRANPPDVVVNIMLPPAAYILMNQLYEQGVAPSAQTWLYDGAGIADYPDFWQNVKKAGKYMLAFGLYHPPDADARAGQASRADLPAAEQVRAQSPDLPGRRFGAADRPRHRAGQVDRQRGDHQGPAGHGIRRHARQVPLLAGCRLQIPAVGRHPLRHVPADRDRPAAEQDHADPGIGPAAGHRQGRQAGPVTAGRARPSRRAPFQAPAGPRRRQSTGALLCSQWTCSSTA
ncbi:ABC transporter substrate-binding protein [Bordetella genomosp. 2]|uniref:ABC transporter substrate-binding protein n=1 Tax=Bordetella genomosp. 2 TaxID=1983456 RepID=UPI00201646F8|nr:ABC transporter substrate-binding protein [Bordetella genomosp. 2]